MMMLTVDGWWGSWWSEYDTNEGQLRPDIWYFIEFSWCTVSDDFVYFSPRFFELCFLPGTVSSLFRNRKFLKSRRVFSWNFVHSNLTSQQASEEGSAVSCGGGWMLWQKQYFIPVNQLHAVRIKRTHFRTIHTPPPSSPSTGQSIARFRHVRITIATREWLNFH